jgi:hypothetical protein
MNEGLGKMDGGTPLTLIVLNSPFTNTIYMISRHPKN